MWITLPTTGWPTSREAGGSGQLRLAVRSATATTHTTRIRAGCRRGTAVRGRVAAAGVGVGGPDRETLPAARPGLPGDVRHREGDEQVQHEQHDETCDDVVA